MSEWIQRIQALVSRFREAALTHCAEDERAGILPLLDQLRNICFVQGLYSDRIQTIVRSRNQEDFDETAETAFEEESAIVSKMERYKGQDTNPVQCTFCKKTGHASSKCFLKNKRENRVSHFSAKKPTQTKEIACYACGEKGHIARNCKKNQKTFRTGEPKNRDFGKREGTFRSQSADGQYYTAGCISEDNCEFLELEVDVRKTENLRLLLDTGADISLIKCTTLLGTTEYDPDRKIKVKSVDGAIVETHGTEEVCIGEGNLKDPTPFPFSKHASRSCL
jgi:hypothetical protein